MYGGEAVVIGDDISDAAIGGLIAADGWGTKDKMGVELTHEQGTREGGDVTDEVLETGKDCGRVLLDMEE